MQVGIDVDEGVIEFFGASVPIARLIGALLAVLAVLAVSWILRRGLRGFADRGGSDRRAAIYTVSRVLHYVLIGLGILVALTLLEVPLSKFTLLSGAVGVGLGFGLQTIFNNFVSGLILLFDKSLKVGDFVELESGVHGLVRDIKTRATTIVTNENIDILVPNSEFVNGRVVNWTHREVDRRMRIPFGVAYGSDKEVVRLAAMEAAEQVPFTLALDGARRPQVWLTDFGDSALEFELVVWLKGEAVSRPYAVKAAYNWALHTALQRHGLEIPFPQRDLNLRGLFGLRDDEALAALNLEPARRTVNDEASRPVTNDAVDEVSTEAGDLDVTDPEQ